jgi:hypothetical protein
MARNGTPRAIAPTHCSSGDFPAEATQTRRFEPPRETDLSQRRTLPGERPAPQSGRWWRENRFLPPERDKRAEVLAFWSNLGLRHAADRHNLKSSAD